MILMAPIPGRAIATASLAVWLPLATAACAARSGHPTPHPFPTPTAGRSADASPGASAAIDVPALIDTALRLRGVPYRNGGSDPSGFDCSGFTQYVFAQYHVPLPRDVRTQYDAGIPIAADRVMRGDLVFFSTTEPGPSHVGIALDDDQFVHAPSSNGVVRVERRHASYWAGRFVGARRVTPP